MAEGLEEYAEFFTLTYEEPTLISLGRRFQAIAPLLWLRAGARGERIAEVAEEGLVDSRGRLLRPALRHHGVGRVRRRCGARDQLTHAFIVTDSLVEYQQIVA